MTYTEKDIKLIEEFQKFADSILWSNDDGSEKYIGVGNMADWWLPKIHQAEQEVLKKVRGEIKKLDNYKMTKPWSGIVETFIVKSDLLSSLDKPLPDKLTKK